MPRTAPRPQPLPGSVLLAGLSTYALCLLLRFGFGWVAGSRSGRPTEVARADTPPTDAKPPEVRPSDNTLAERPAPKETPPAEPATPKKAPAKTEPPRTEAPKAEAKKPPEPKKEAPKAEPPAANVTFTKDVLPVFRKYCLDCHSGPKPKGSVDLTTLAAITKGGKNGRPILKPGDAAASSVYATVEDGAMPPEGKAPTDAEKKL